MHRITRTLGVSGIGTNDDDEMKGEEDNSDGSADGHHLELEKIWPDGRQAPWGGKGILEPSRRAAAGSSGGWGVCAANTFCEVCEIAFTKSPRGASGFARRM